VNPIDSGFPARLAHALSWQRWLATAALSALALTWIYRTLFDLTLTRALGTLPWLVGFGAITLVCVALAEASAPRGRLPSTARYVTAIVVAALIAGAVAARFNEPLRRALANPAAGAAQFPPHVLPVASAIFASANVLIFGLVVVLAYGRLQHVRLAARVLSEAEIARADAQRRLASWHLRTVHGEVDPTSVITRLEEIERTYDGDAARADAMLEALIEKLRTSIPRMRTERITGGAP